MWRDELIEFSWVIINGEPKQLTQQDLYDLSRGLIQCDPIPLRTEYLEFNGWEHPELHTGAGLWGSTAHLYEIKFGRGGNDQNTYNLILGKCSGPGNFDDNPCWSERGYGKDIFFVHQLQFLLAALELEYKDFRITKERDPKIWERIFKRKNEIYREEGFPER